MEGVCVIVCTEEDSRAHGPWKTAAVERVLLMDLQWFVEMWDGWSMQGHSKTLEGVGESHHTNIHPFPTLNPPYKLRSCGKSLRSSL